MNYVLTCRVLFNLRTWYTLCDQMWPTCELVIPVQNTYTAAVEPRLTHWGQVTHICVSKLTIIGSDIGLSPGRRQSIIWTGAGILLIGPLGSNFDEIFVEIHTFSFKKMRVKVSSAKWWTCCLGLNCVLTKLSDRTTNQKHSLDNTRKALR